MNDTAPRKSADRTLVKAASGGKRPPVDGGVWRACWRLARFHRPIGSWLLLLPCWWGLGLAWGQAGKTADTGNTGEGIIWLILHAALFAAGALAMRGAGCCWNDISDRRLDARVARTADRPLASGTLSLTVALAFMALLALIGLLVLLQFNRETQILGLLSLPLVALYPFMKRVTWFPQAWLGLTFNWGALMGWTALTGGLSAPALALYGAGIFWTLGYDTIYAHQDKQDDLLVGVKSTALKFADHSRPWIGGFYGATILLLALAGHLAAAGWAFGIGLMLGATHLLWQVMRVDFADGESCARVFAANRDFGLIVTAAILADAALGRL